MTKELKNQRRRELYKQYRDQLIKDMGNRCFTPSFKCTNQLQFDHIYGRTYELGSGYSIYTLKRYRDEYNKGLLRLLCSYHNQSLGAKKKNSGFRNNFLLPDEKKINKKNLFKIQNKNNSDVSGIFSRMGRGAVGRGEYIRGHKSEFGGKK
jgi:hypothetical protein